MYFFISECPSGTNDTLEGCYILGDKLSTWSEARSYCALNATAIFGDGRSMQLVSIESKEEDIALYDWLFDINMTKGNSNYALFFSTLKLRLALYMLTIHNLQKSMYVDKHFFHQLWLNVSYPTAIFVYLRSCT